MTGEDFEVLLALVGVLTPPRDGRAPIKHATLDLILGARYSGEPYERGYEWEADRPGWSGRNIGERVPCPCACHDDRDLVCGEERCCLVCGDARRGTVEGPPTGRHAGLYPTNRERVVRSLARLYDLDLIRLLWVPDDERTPNEREACPSGASWEHRARHAELTRLGEVMVVCGGMDPPPRRRAAVVEGRPRRLRA